MEFLDDPKPVRSGEELDADALFECLKSRIDGLTAPLEVQQFPSGHSNLTYFVKSGDREYVLRRPPFGAKHIKAGHDMHREFRVLSGLVPVYPKAPRPVCYVDEAESPFEASFYLMERVRGVVLRAKPPAGLVLESATLRTLSENFIDNLADLHAVDWQAAGLGEMYRGDGYVKRQVEGWVKRYRASQTDDVPEIERVVEWITSNVPADSAATMIHNDYKYDNIILDPSDITTIRAVLDWEMATVGDPLTDVGMALAYWVDPEDAAEVHAMSFGLTALPGNLNRAQLLERYGARSGRDLSGMRWHTAFAQFKVAGIIQQIYYRYKQGFTKDERFARMGTMVKLFGSMAERTIG